MKGSSIPDSLGRHKPQTPPDLFHRASKIRTDEMEHSTLSHANFLDIKARAMGLRRLVACGDLLGAWTPDNYVPIKFNDCPLFRLANADASLSLPSYPSLPMPIPATLRLYNCATESATTIIRGRNPITF